MQKLRRWIGYGFNIRIRKKNVIISCFQYSTLKSVAKEELTNIEVIILFIANNLYDINQLKLYEIILMI